MDLKSAAIERQRRAASGRYAEQVAAIVRELAARKGVTEAQALNMHAGRYGMTAGEVEAVRDALFTRAAADGAVTVERDLRIHNLDRAWDVAHAEQAQRAGKATVPLIDHTPPTWCSKEGTRDESDQSAP